MTTEDKLLHFTTVTIESVQKECDAMLAEYKEKMDKYYQEHTEESIKKAKLKMGIAEDGIKRKASQEYTSMQMHIKRKINHKQEEIKDKLFAEVCTRLKEYVKTPEYEKYILRKIDDMKDLAGSEELHIILDIDDAALQEKIMESSTVKISVSEKSFLGGVRGEIPSRNILIDDSFESKFEDLKETYIVSGGR
ncbi:MAG: hypothetical protein GX225_01150 [Clostridiales bacterium]|nr:hypothetical protein [Clostridiales bacterium]